MKSLKLTGKEFTFMSQDIRIIRGLAQEHGVSEEAVKEIYRALVQGRGSMAQFSHPDLGGSGQWMSSGMIMLGDMFNNSLKAKVDSLCRALASQAANANFSQAYSQPISDSSWWPKEFSNPTSAGAQNNVRYAYFSNNNALVIDSGGTISVYDTTGFTITGFSQQQSSFGTFSFSSTSGTVMLSHLPKRY